MKKINGVLYSVKEEDLNLYHYNNQKFWEGVKVIGRSAFKGLDIKSIIVPDQVGIIEESAFEDCKNLSAVNLKNVRVLSRRAFSGCENLGLVIMHEGLEKIGEGCFYRCKRLEEIKVPSTVNVIDKAAFASSGLTWAILKESSIRCLNNSVFEKCYNLKMATLPSSLRVIRSKAFADCKSLPSLSIPSTVYLENIARDAFIGCDNLDKICYKKHLFGNAFIKIDKVNGNIIDEESENQ